MGKTNSIPSHVGLILDGNRRWAQAHDLPTFEGHNRGVDAFLKCAPLFFDAGVRYISVFIFSTENWKRTPQEVKYLMRLFLTMAETKIDDLHKRGIRTVFLGRRDKLNQKLVDAIEVAEQKTANNQEGTVAFCLNYGGTYEVIDAFKRLIKARIDVDTLEPSDLDAYLYHPELPPVDVVVRTSGELRLSNFMIWRTTYSEFISIKKNWPDFGESDVSLVLREYAKRERRHGGDKK